MKKKKLQESPRIIPAGTKQETGFTRFIKKEKKSGEVKVIKDAKANNEKEIHDAEEGISTPEPGASPDTQRSRLSGESEDTPLQDQNQD